MPPAFVVQISPITVITLENTILRSMHALRTLYKDLKTQECVLLE